MTKRKSKSGNYLIEELGPIELTPAQDRKVRRAMKAMEKESDPVRVNFRWQVGALEFIKDVSAAMGIPYQTYMKQVLYRQALEDLERIGKRQENLETKPKRTQRTRRKPSKKK